MKLAVPQPPAYLLQDMTVSVDIEVARREAVLLLPDRCRCTTREHLAVGARGARGGASSGRTVKLGARGEGRVEILAGLAEGEHVVPSTRDRPGRGQARAREGAEGGRQAMKS